MSAPPIRPRQGRDTQEFGPGKPDYLVCPLCSAVYGDKSWRANFAAVRGVREDKRIVFMRCPACEMIREGKFEGEVIMQGVPAKRAEEVLNRIRNVGERAYQRDPMDRIISLSRRGSRIVVTTTENQLALRIGRAIKKLLRGDLDIHWSDDEDIVRIRWKPS